MSAQSLKYSDAGVDIGAWNAAKGRIGELVKKTYTPNVIGKFGQFGGLFNIAWAKNMEKPVLVSSIDGVGTKLKIAFEMNIHDTVGEDIVNHCINDILVLGAQPMFFLDYLGTGKLEPDVAAKIVEGLSRACQAAGCALIGGETAEMPGFYAQGEYDLAGCIVGVVDEKNVVDGSAIKSGDLVIGFRSNGLHTNGYSLARKIVTEVAGKSFQDSWEPSGVPFGKELLRPHRSYLPVLKLIRERIVKGCAHITGGGFTDNIDRILPDTCDAHIQTKSWTPDPIFTWIQKTGGVEDKEMYKTFNMGVGLIVVVDPKNRDRILQAEDFQSFGPVEIGKITGGSGAVAMEFGK
ncbi:MAG: phosphoribosylformylglycinamidine cyclo-ligase [Chitinivibrionales bacterium]|nr:phosphoribosylformylglycinamidine cyclo-ligase [Chitinivibrionales bacterium]